MSDKKLTPVECTNPGTIKCFFSMIIVHLIFMPVAWVLDLFGYDLTAYITAQE